MIFKSKYILILSLLWIPLYIFSVITLDIIGIAFLLSSIFFQSISLFILSITVENNRKAQKKDYILHLLNVINILWSILFSVYFLDSQNYIEFPLLAESLDNLKLTSRFILFVFFGFPVQFYFVVSHVRKYYEEWFVFSFWKSFFMLFFFFFGVWNLWSVIYNADYYKVEK